VIGKITASGQVEGGDLIWLDERRRWQSAAPIAPTPKASAVQGYRRPGVHVEVAVMPHYKGQSMCSI
jgi:hypothetical protein